MPLSVPKMSGTSDIFDSNSSVAARRLPDVLRTVVSFVELLAEEAAPGDFGVRRVEAELLESRRPEGEEAVALRRDCERDDRASGGDLRQRTLVRGEGRVDAARPVARRETSCRGATPRRL